RSNLLLRSIVKAVLYPLLGILHAAQWVYVTLSFNPELAIVAAGIFASGLIGIVYFAPPTLLALSLARRKVSRLTLKPLAYAWVACVLLLVISELSSAPVLMMFSTASLVLTTIAGSAIYTVARAQRLLK
ncbi:hypothetical protein KEJ23_02475, partial [Candidatus Bathyarchaeota archaeon]|nr:hypothetical protein [Candidatus Bathyarchaeota archaeon]